MELEYNSQEHCRLDKFLVEAKINILYSRNYIDKLINSDNILVNGKPVKKSHQLKSGDLIKITIPEQQKTDLQPENIALDILYEDEQLAIINKAAGITVHPAPGNESGTLVNALLYHFRDNLSSGSGQNRPGIVHRLDKDTSGLLLIAKDDKTQSQLSRMFQKREIEKYYKAIVVGVPPEDEGIIKTGISRSKSERKKMSVATVGKEALTYYRIDRHYDVFSLLEVKLETGRTHQIRVHFSHINCPILGDRTYSSLKRTLNKLPYNFHKKVKYLLANHLKRQALHAWRIKLKHPVTGKIIDIEAPLPADLLYCLNWLEDNFRE
jgi:23S rRNA pseudouridine1911/1915/1917 synthase